MRYIKHMAFAVRDLDAAMDYYRTMIGVGHDARIVEAAKARVRVAIFNVGDVEYQVTQSMDPDGRFSKWIDERGFEGLHHICYAVDNIDESLETALAHGATLKECSSCKVTGKHPHPEGFIAFLEQEAGGIETELMQVYTPAELEEYKSIKGI
jgi:methylmalonyl-CoA/ethylmalonyl-CoA epimerase